MPGGGRNGIDAIVKTTFREFVEHQGKHMSYKTFPGTFLRYHMYHTSVNHGSRVKLYMCALTLNGVPVMMEIDTGATISIISSRQFANHI